MSGIYTILWEIARGVFHPKFRSACWWYLRHLEAPAAWRRCCIHHDVPLAQALWVISGMVVCARRFPAQAVFRDTRRRLSA